ncbi:hypothetical protein EVG20_g6038 [Dentipellis fragilis]|uniref:Uncharacterized protein n=1 Tax=Dentipellis fragilis TaxID=205917 RepID=A0A4Y9YQW8_9AGAM|nr:hypothetical protein EVG20_g6038 [Dentipellis fragilis]
MAPIKLGFVGLSSTGWAANALAPVLLQKPLSDEYSMVAVSTRSAESASASAEKYSKLAGSNVKAYHGSTEAIAEDPEVDLVAISVKTPDHKGAVLPAIEKRKDVFLEWPLGNGLQESIELAEVARRKGIRTFIGLQSWQSPAVNKVREWVSSGQIGRVLSVNWIGSKPAEVPYWVPFSNSRDLYALDPQNGATLLSIFVGHNLSAITYALGPLSSVTATSAQLFKETRLLGADGSPSGETRTVTGADQYSFSGILRDSGAILTASWRSGITTTKESDKHRPSLIWLIDGDEGHIRVESTSTTGGAFQIAGGHKVILNGKEVDVFEREDTLGNTGRAWQEFAKGEVGNYPNFDDAVTVYRQLDAIERSAKEGRRVETNV